MKNIKRISALILAALFLGLMLPLITASVNIVFPSKTVTFCNAFMVGIYADIAILITLICMIVTVKLINYAEEIE